MVTQLFFDNERFYDFQDKCTLAGINVPIHAGVMPILNRNQALRLLKTCENVHIHGSLKPFWISTSMIQNPFAQLVWLMQSIKSLIWSLKMWQGVHLYTMNNEDVAYHVYQATKALFDHQPNFEVN